MAFCDEIFSVVFFLLVLGLFYANALSFCVWRTCRGFKCRFFIDIAVMCQLYAGKYTFISGSIYYRTVNCYIMEITITTTCLLL